MPGPRLKQLRVDGAVDGDVLTFNGTTWTPRRSGEGEDVGVYNNASGMVSVRDAVYISSAGAVSRADADDVAAATFPAIGLVVSTIDATSCRVQLQGEMSGFTGLNSCAF